MFFGLLYFCVVILCVNRSRSSFILYRIVKRHSRQSNVRRIWTCADNVIRQFSNRSRIAEPDLWSFRGSGMKAKVQAALPSWYAEPELFQFKANIPYLIKKKSKAQKYHIHRNQHKNLRKIISYGYRGGSRDVVAGGHWKPEVLNRAAKGDRGRGKV